jgi:protein gp37
MREGNLECWDTVWNPVRGCTPVSIGCENCIAARQAGYLERYRAGGAYDGLVRWDLGARPTWTGRSTSDPEKLMEPLMWSRPRRVLVCNAGDLFGPRVPDGFISDVFMSMAMNEQHTFYVATKYALQMEQWFGSWACKTVMDLAAATNREWPLPNVWMGISAENQSMLDTRAAHLVAVPAAHRFLLLEPLLGPMELERVECPVMREETCALCSDGLMSGPITCCANGYYNLLEEGIDWVVAGCETGPRTRIRGTMDKWVREIRDQCEANNIPFFYKQALGRQGQRVSLPLLDNRQWMETPV